MEIGNGPISILLASGSPRRRALLADLGWRFEWTAPRVDESPLPGEAPEVGEGVLVLAADTIVVVDGRVLGKPADLGESRGMLAHLQGREHEVLTGVALRWSGRTVSAVERTAVRFRPLTPGEVAAYAATGEGMDKAGSYAIQGRGALLVSGIDGDYFNVVGLPLCRLGMLLESVGLSLERLWAGL